MTRQARLPRTQRTARLARKVDHIGIAVRDTAAALQLYAAGLGLKAEPTTRLDDEGVLVTFVEAGGTRLEVLEPLRADSPVGRFLEKRGEGLHHICLAIPDLEAACAELAAQGYELVDDAPRTRPDGQRYAFLHPRSTSGVLIELYEVGGAPVGRPKGVPEGRRGGAHVSSSGAAPLRARARRTRAA